MTKKKNASTFLVKCSCVTCITYELRKGYKLLPTKKKDFSRQGF